MFLNFFNLREYPFGETPDPRFFFFSPTHCEAIASVFFGIDSGRGFSAIIAQPGMGKTTVLNHLKEALKESIRTVSFCQLDRSPRRLQAQLMSEFGVAADREDAGEQIARALIAEAARGVRMLLIIDEAQNLDSSVLESIRLLSNIETPRSKLLHIVLAGQPELAEHLRMPSLAQLRQRISSMCPLKPLDREQVRDYISHRLRLAGRERDPIFTTCAMDLVAYCSAGIPRNINTLCANAMTFAFGRGQKTIDYPIVEEVAADLDLALLASPTNSRTCVETIYSNETFGSDMERVNSLLAPAQEPRPGGQLCRRKYEGHF